MRRQKVWFRSLLAAGVLVAALAGPAPALDGVFGAACAGASGPALALVVDFGDVTTAGPRPGGVEVHCIPHPGRMTGLEALRSAGYQLRFAPSGLLCAVNGYPAEGCGERQGGGRRYLYWSYWRGNGGGWEYAGIGPATPVRAGAVEGWRFVEGSSSPSDPQPRWAPDHAAICGAEAGGPPVPSGGGGAAAVAPAPPLDAPAPGTDPAAPQVPGLVDGDSTSTTAASEPGPDEPQSALESTGSQGTVVAGVDEQAFVRADEDDEGSGIGRALGFGAVAAIVVALGVLAVRRSRRGA